ncbi:MAG: hypothetical protein QM499_05995 [Flavobacteriaceae bacterium]
MTCKKINILLTLLSFGFSFAQETKSVAIDTNTVSVKEFENNIPEKYTSNNFDYNAVTSESQNYLLRFISWFFEQLEKIFGINVDPDMYKTVEILIYVILIIIAVYIISRLFLNTNTTSFFSKKSKDLAPISFEEEHIEQINLEELIKNALSQSDFRLAIRYMYLKTLKDLSINNLIDWHYDKTNFDYQNELKSPNLSDSFGRVSYLYDHIWYGEFGLDESEFSKAKKEFDQLTKAINSHG